ncbi:MAG: Wadjet anti-phage system protein JetD domain-containing protein [Ferrovibrio sp.]|uniref:Wadjet anti-phage system protein JetD domain-containing protein n=1 Tax=Ferrovibrio sp. TaxID=1917215 RepID=UPI0039192E41
MPAKMPLKASDVPILGREQDMVDIADLDKRGLLKFIRDSKDVVDGHPGRVEILKPAEMARLLSHKSHSSRLAEARSIIDEIVGERQDFLAQAGALLLEAWQARRPAFGLRVEETDHLKLMMTFLDAISRGAHQNKDVRQFSTSLGLGSKDFESVQSVLIKILARLFDLPENDALLETIGLVRYGQPVLVSGPVALDGCVLPTAPYIAIPPENAGRLRPAEGARYLLTIENLASFHRQVRSVKDGGIVIFTGGFPAPAIIAAVTGVSGHNPEFPKFHWGDIDAGGLTIFHFLEDHLPGLAPHLMTKELAAGGSPIQPDRRLDTIAGSGSAVAGLADWLRGADARKLEQEALEPRSPLGDTSENDTV